MRHIKTKTTAVNQAKASELLAYLVRRHTKTSQTRKIRKIRSRKTEKKPTGVLKNVMQENPKGSKNNIRAEEEQMTAARAKQHEREEDAGIRPAGREK